MDHRRLHAYRNAAELNSPSSMTDVPGDFGISGVARSRTYLSNAVSSSNSVRLVGLEVSST